MPEPLKNLFSHAIIIDMANHFDRHYEGFDKVSFLTISLQNLDDLELKQRANQIVKAMECTFPSDFSEGAEIMFKSLVAEDGTHKSLESSQGISGWAIMPMAEYVGLYGQDHFSLSMDLFEAFTKRFTAEFGIRHFLIAFPNEVLEIFYQWTDHANYHVRRLVSEGCRPRLPWGMQLPIFIENPRPLLGLLEKLKDDNEEYVRRSVANNLNDIAKDHPDLVAQTLKRWNISATQNRKKLIRHAARTLLKQGHPVALESLGYLPPKLKYVNLTMDENVVIFGSKLEFSIQLEAQSEQEQLLMVDFAIHHVKANGELKAKVFKWKSFSLQHGQPFTISKSHPIKAITTRRYYPGTHKVEVLINGVSVAIKSFELNMEKTNKTT